MDKKRPGCSFLLNSSWRKGGLDRISCFMSGCNVGEGRLESFLQHCTKISICKMNLSLKRKCYVPPTLIMKDGNICNIFQTREISIRSIS